MTMSNFAVQRVPVRRAPATTMKGEDWLAELPPPPEALWNRWLTLMERLTVDERIVVELADHEARFRRNIIAWILADPRREQSARRMLPTGYVVHAWSPQNDLGRVVLIRTR